MVVRVVRQLGVPHPVPQLAVDLERTAGRLGPTRALVPFGAVCAVRAVPVTHQVAVLAVLDAREVDLEA
jgi:hypothetical protein